MTTYAEFRLRIEQGPTPNTYRVESSGLGGDMSATFELPFSDAELENIILKLGRTRRGVRKIESPETEIARAFGGRLFKTVMAGGIGESYRAAHSEANRRAEGLRVTLSLTSAPRLATIPWEFLFDEPDFLATSPETPIVRFLEVARPHRPIEISLPLRILVVICSPKGAEQLNTGLERANLEPALKPLIDLDAVKIDWLEHATLGSLNTQLRSESYHILHFIGHGGFDEARGEGALLFEDESGQGAIVGADRLAGILRSRSSIRLVVLNSCEGARSSIDDPFSGVAASLIERGFPAVIGMQFEISDRAAILFAREFYTVLAEGDPVDKAVAESRLAMFAGQDDVEWGTPVLYMRVDDGRLFSIANAVPIAREEQKPAEAADSPVDVPTDVPVDAGVPAGPAVPTGAAATATPIADTAPAPGPTWEPAAPESVAQPQPKPERPRSIGRPSRRALALLGAAIAVPIAAVALYLVLAGPQPTVRGREIIARPGYVHITGEGFQPNERIDLSLSALHYEVPVDANGAFETEVLVGRRASGPIIAIGQISGRRADSFYALYEYGVSPDPSSAPSSAPPSGATGSCLDPGIRERSIVFYSDVDVDGRALDEIAVFCIDPTTGKIASVLPEAELHDQIDDTFAAWSPDHTQVAFTRRFNDRDDRSIFIREEDGSVTPLLDSADNDYFPAWSSNGWIAFVRDEGERSSIMRMRVGDQAAERMAAGRTYRAPAWSTDGSTLAFFGFDRLDDFDLATIRTPGEIPKWITGPKNNDLNPAWAADGRTILFVMDQALTGSNDNDIYLMDADTRRITKQLTGRTVSTGSGVQDGNPVWSPDESQIAFYRRTPTGYHIWVMNSDGTGQRDLMPNRPGVNLDPNWR